MNGGRFDFSDGGSYCGGWEEGKAHGYGVCTGPSGKGEYSGAWNFGFEVIGVYTWPNGSTYEGMWENGMRSGLGVETKGRWIYRGEWTSGFKGKYGVIQSSSSGARYEGTWSSGLQDGYGVETYADGGIYQGQWVGGMRHGYGIRSSVPYGMAAIARPALRTSLTSLRSEQENGSVASVTTENFGQRGGFCLEVNDDNQSDIESVKTTSTFRRTDSKRSNRKLGWRSKRKKDKVESTAETPVGSVSSLRAHLFHQDSLRSNESTFSTGSIESSTYDGETVPLQEETMADDVTETYMGEWKQDKRSGYGISQRSDGYVYIGEWHNNKRHGYGVFTYPDGKREEGKWKNNMLVSSGKKKVFVMGAKKLSERVEKAIALARQSSSTARQKADIAISKAAYAKGKAESANGPASEARQESIKCKMYTKELLVTLPEKAETDQKFDRKKSFFGRHIPVLDRKHHMKGTAVYADPHSRHHQPPKLPDRSVQGNGVSNEWDGRGVSPIPETSMRESRSVGNLIDGSPPPRRRPGPPPRQMSHGFQVETRPVDVSPRVERQDQLYQSYSRDRDRDYNDYDRLVYDMHKDRSVAELTPDSGISTTSDSDRMRGVRPSFHKQRSIGKRQYSLQDEDYYSRHDDHHLQHQYDDDYLRDRDIDRYYDEDSELYSNPSYVDSTHYDEDEEEEVRKKQQQKQKKKGKFTDHTQTQSKSDVPPGHYRSIQGSFQRGYRIKYLPKTDSVEEETKEDELDGDGALVSKKKQHWSASKGLILLVLLLNIGFTILFTSLFLQMEEDGGWDNWP